VQTVRTVAELEKEESSVKFMTRFLEQLWTQVGAADRDEDGYIDPNELRLLLEDRQVAKILHKIGVDLDGLVNAAEFSFDLNGGTLTKPQFKRMVLDLRGKNAAKVKDHVETRKFIHHLFGLQRLSISTRQPAKRSQTTKFNPSCGAAGAIMHASGLAPASRQPERSLPQEAMSHCDARHICL